MTLQLADIVTFWAGRQHRGPDGLWTHDADRAALTGAETLGFNLSYPVSPYLGRILDARVIILNLNGGYNPAVTPHEFAEEGAEQLWLDRVADPSGSDWTGLPTYYHAANYGTDLLSGRFAAINACAYRSPNLQKGSARTLADRLPSVRFHRRWLVEALLPLAKARDRLVVAHRWGLWNIPSASRATANLMFDVRCRAFPDIDAALLSKAQAFTKGLP